MPKTKPPKRAKPTKVKTKNFLKAKGHTEKPDKDTENYLDVVAKHHNINPEELKRILK